MHTGFQFLDEVPFGTTQNPPGTTRIGAPRRIMLATDFKTSGSDIPTTCPIRATVRGASEPHPRRTAVSIYPDTALRLSSNSPLVSPLVSHLRSLSWFELAQLMKSALARKRGSRGPLSHPRARTGTIPRPAVPAPNHATPMGRTAHAQPSRSPLSLQRRRGVNATSWAGWESRL